MAALTFWLTKQANRLCYPDITATWSDLSSSLLMFSCYRSLRQSSCWPTYPNAWFPEAVDPVLPVRPSLDIRCRLARWVIGCGVLGSIHWVTFCVTFSLKYRPVIGQIVLVPDITGGRHVDPTCTFLDYSALRRVGIQVAKCTTAGSSCREYIARVTLSLPGCSSLYDEGGRPRWLIAQ